MPPQTNEEWLAALRQPGPQRESALEALRRQLLRGLGYALGDRLGTPHHPLLEDAVQEALLTILDRLDTFQGRSRFLTWAQTIAVRKALTMLRRKAWQDVRLEDLVPEDAGDFTPAALTDPAPNPEHLSARNEAMRWVQRALQEALTPRQRRAMLAVAIHGMPLEEVARRMQTNRNALYKLLHDARRRLKNYLEAQGISVEDLIDLFQNPASHPQL